MFSVSATTLAIILPGTRAIAAIRSVTLRAQPTDIQLSGDGGQASQMMVYNGVFPGAEIRLQQGDRLNARLENALEEGTLVHWHGIRVPNAMDGVSMLTQEVLPPRQSFDYRFSVPDAGTFWYHAHYLSHDQVARGLFGPLIVTEALPPDVDRDITVQLLDLKVDANGRFDPNTDTSAFTTLGRIGNDQRAHLSDPRPVRIGDRIRLRLINTATDRIVALQITGLDGRLVALDGMPLAAQRNYDIVTLGPGQRADVIGDVTGVINLNDVRYNVQALGGLLVSGERTKRQVAVTALPPNPAAPLGSPAQNIELVMQGGASGGAHGGFAGWAFNDVSGLSGQPLARIGRNETMIIRLVNATAWPHAIHLHGQHFYEIGADGSVGDYRDTTLLEPGQARNIACQFTNRGRWLLHCHMLSHQADGMATWIDVT